MDELHSWNIHDDMNLYITPDRIMVEVNAMDKVLIIDRVSSMIKVQLNKRELQNLSPNRRVCGILGTIRLVAGDYLLVATHRLYVGMINSAVIWRLAGYDIIPYIPTTTHLTPKQREHNETYLQMLRKTLDTNYFYFSYDERYDITHSVQRKYNMTTDLNSLSVIERADSRFVWNGALLNNFQCKEMQKFQLPLILGFVSINQVLINGQTFVWSIVSRRSIHKAGTRFYSRGINDAGQVANFVETEQIVEFNGERISFVQTRGSMPFFWRQLPNLRYKPRPHIIPGRDHLNAFNRHFEEQIAKYGHQVLVNLVDQKGAEGALETSYRKFAQQLNNSNIRYEAFDFHAECKKMRWDRLNILIDRLAHEQEEFSVFHIRDDGRVVSTQHGVFRTNCIDCLDRTNVVQSMLARRSLNSILQKLGILHVGQKLESASPQFDLIFKGVWADNADMISLQYSGTGALKTDFTRTGKRTTAGLVQDGVNSMTRYYLNNFADGFRQDGIDLFLGRYTVTASLPSPLEVKHTWHYNAVDQKGAEGALETSYRKFAQQLNNSNIRYEAFDFHAECKKMRWDRLNILIDRLAHEQEEFSVFHIRDDGRVVSTQHGVFRTNCIDCLDRTNVVQSMLARRSLNSILQKLGILHVGQKLESASPQFDLIFKGVWADNADMISLQYSGTGALKTDFTRTGKRTTAGLVQDGVNSMTRYYLNNFADGFRQDGIDLFLGRYTVTASLPSPLEVKHTWHYNAFPSILIFSIAMLFLTALVPAEFNTENLLFMLFWGALIGVSISGIFHYGLEFVDWPRLFRPIKFQI